MKFRTKDELLYLAGILDARMKLHCNDRLRVRLRLDGKIASYLKREFGGTVYQHYAMPHFEATGKAAFRLLKRVLPYLQLRDKKAKECMGRWQEHKQRRK